MNRADTFDLLGREALRCARFAKNISSPLIALYVPDGTMDSRRRGVKPKDW